MTYLLSSVRYLLLTQHVAVSMEDRSLRVCYTNKESFNLRLTTLFGKENNENVF